MGRWDRDASEGEGPPRRPQRRLDRRLEEVAKAVGGGYQSVTNAIEAGACRQGEAGRRLGALHGVPPPPLQCIPEGGRVNLLGLRAPVTVLQPRHGHTVPSGQRDPVDRPCGAPPHARPAPTPIPPACPQYERVLQVQCLALLLLRRVAGHAAPAAELPERAQRFDGPVQRPGPRRCVLCVACAGPRTPPRARFATPSMTRRGALGGGHARCCGVNEHQVTCHPPPPPQIRALFSPSAPPRGAGGGGWGGPS